MEVSLTDRLRAADGLTLVDVLFSVWIGVIHDGTTADLVLGRGAWRGVAWRGVALQLTEPVHTHTLTR